MLDIGTPDEVVERRHLRVAELEVDRATEAADVAARASRRWTRSPTTATTCGWPPATRSRSGPRSPRRALAPLGIEVAAYREARVTVEDAFVVDGRAEERAARQAA